MPNKKRMAAYDLVLAEVRWKRERIETAIRVLEEYLATRKVREDKYAGADGS